MHLIDTDLSKFSVMDYRPGNKLKIVAWYIVSLMFFDNGIPWPYSWKNWILRVFGCKTGTGIIIKPNVRIKYPWHLTIGNTCWIGENVWIDNLDQVNIANNVCLSQGSMLLTGNHDYTLSDFPYRLGTIVIEDGVWIGAKSVVCPGIICASHSILTVNSVATKNLEARKIYSGNPASFTRERIIVR